MQIEATNRVETIVRLRRIQRTLSAAARSAALMAQALTDQHIEETMNDTEGRRVIVINRHDVYHRLRPTGVSSCGWWDEESLAGRSHISINEDEAIARGLRLCKTCRTIEVRSAIREATA